MGRGAIRNQAHGLRDQKRSSPGAFLGSNLPVTNPHCVYIHTPEASISCESPKASRLNSDPTSDVVVDISNPDYTAHAHTHNYYTTTYRQPHDIGIHPKDNAAICFSQVAGHVPDLFSSYLNLGLQNSVPCNCMPCNLTKHEEKRKKETVSVQGYVYAFSKQKRKRYAGRVAAFVY